MFWGYFYEYLFPQIPLAEPEQTVYQYQKDNKDNSIYFLGSD